MERTKTSQADSLRLLLILFMLLPLVILFFLPGVGLLLSGMWFWMLLIVIYWLMVMLVGTPAHGPAVGVPVAGSARTADVYAIPVPPIVPAPRVLPVADIPPAVLEAMDVRVALEEAGVVVFRGPLREPADQAFARIKREVADRAVPFLQEDEELGARLVLMPRPLEEEQVEKEVRPWVNWLLFALTLCTTTWAGAAYQGVNLLREPGRFWVGLPYSLGLLSILGVHELGHYFTAKHHRMRVTPPYFIPVPFALGTFGAFIKMKSPPENRTAMFDVAVAGPLAGLVIAVPALLIGLRYSQVLSGEPAVAAGQGIGMGGTAVNSSILLALIAKLSIPDELRYGHVLLFHPLAFAGWLGLFVTALNLLPIGQLDGGHMARAMFGSRIGRIISMVSMWTLFLLALFVWPGLFMWALIVFFIAARGTPPLNDLMPISTGRKALGWVTFLILILILSPLPRGWCDSLGMNCPYL
jgi:membrane-associated protease RseP (regulator of RpoE activity)